MSNNIANIEQLKQWVKKEYENGTTILKISCQIKARYENILISYYGKNIKPKDFIYSIILDEELVCSECGNIRTYHHNIKRMTCKKSCPSSKRRYTKTVIERYGTDNPMKNENVKSRLKKSIIEKYGVDNVAKLPEIYEKIRKTNLEKYNTIHPMKHKEIRQKAIETNIERYGADNPMKNEKIKYKFKETIKNKYGVEHVAKNKEVKRKIKNTFLKKYGVDNPMKLDYIREKTKETVLKKYGTDNVSKVPEIRKKIKEKFLDRYGVDNPAKAEEIKEKIKQTNLDKYGAPSPLESDQIKEKIRLTNLQKYGEEIPLKSKILRNKITQTNLQKYGVDNPLKSPEIREKIKQTNLQKYGSAFPSRKHYSELALKFVENKDFAEQVIKEHKTLKKIANYLDISHHTVANTAKKFDLVDLLDLRPSVSYYETQICETIKKFYDGEIIRNSRELISPYEIDIYIPEFRLGIEFHGLFYHSELFKDKTYHYDKFLKSREKGITLIQIFEDEWLEKREICEALIRNKLNAEYEVIYARNCHVQNIKNKKYKDFLEKYHLQGYTNAKYKYGLFHNDELIAVISFSPSRPGIGKKFSKSYELVRYAVKFGKRIVGGFEKLLKHFIKSENVKYIHTYTDNRFFNGHSLIRANFRLVNHGNPSYWYVDLENNRRLHRFAFAKFNLVKKFGHMFEDIESMTERQIMEELGYLRIYDAGHSKWVYHVR